MTEELDKQIEILINDTDGEIDPIDILSSLVAGGYLDQARMDRITIVGPLDEWIELKVKRIRSRGKLKSK